MKERAQREYSTPIGRPFTTPIKEKRIKFILAQDLRMRHSFFILEKFHG